MLCDGKCIIKNKSGKEIKRCGMLQDMAHFKPDGNKIPGSDYTRCVFGAILDKFSDLQKDNIRLQAAVESSRNEKAKGDMNTSHTVAMGMLGIIHALTDNEKGKQAVKKLNRLADNMQKQFVAIEEKEAEERKNIVIGQEA